MADFSKMTKEELNKQLKNKEKLLGKVKSEKVKQKLEGEIKEIKSAISKVKEPKKEENKKSKPAKKLSGPKTLEECRKVLAEMARRYDVSASTKKKNIKSGRAEKDGSLKPGASLENEADSIEGKAEKGQRVTKKDINKIRFSIESIVRNCVEMIRVKKDADQLLKDLIEELNDLRNQIRSGRLKPGKE